MTVIRLACSILVLILAQTAVSAADDMPRRKSGLWELKMSMGGKASPMGTMQTCVDQASDDLMQSNAKRATAKNCTRSDIKRDGNRVLVHSECTLDKMKTISDAVFSGSFDSGYRGDITTQAEVVCQHSSTALANALEHQNLFLMPVWRALGKTRWILEARTLPKTLSIGGAKGATP